MSIKEQDPISPDMSKKNIMFVLGGPGTGKTTQCKLLAKKYPMAHITIGQVLFQSNHSQSKIKSLNWYEPLSSVEITALFDTIFNKAQSQFVLLEGFVRTKRDFLQWSQQIEDKTHIVGALYLHCPEETMKYRLFNRDDDAIEDVEDIVEALNSYKCEEGLINDLEAHNKLMYIDSNASIKDTLKRIETLFKNHSIIIEKVKEEQIKCDKYEWTLWGLENEFIF